MSIEALPCIICGATLRNVDEDAENQPDYGVACSTPGNYGSRVYDPVLSGEFLEFNLCDDCLVRAGEQGRIYAARAAIPVIMDVWGVIGWVKAPYRPVVWHKDLPSYTDEIRVSSMDEVSELGSSLVKLNIELDVLEGLFADLDKLDSKE